MHWWLSCIRKEKQFLMSSAIKMLSDICGVKDLHVMLVTSEVRRVTWNIVKKTQYYSLVDV